MFTNKRWNTILGGFVVVVVILGITGVLTAAPESQEGTDYPNKVYLPIVSHDTGSVDNSTPTPVSGDITEEDLGNGWIRVTDYGLGIRFDRPDSWYYGGYGSLASYDLMEAGRTGYRLTESDVKVLMGWLPPDSEKRITIESGVTASKSTAKHAVALDMTYLRIGDRDTIYMVSQSISAMSQGTVFVDYFLAKDGEYFYINMRPEKTAHRETLEQVISTIEFLDK